MNNTTTKTTIMEQVKQYLLDNEEVIQGLVSEINSYDSSLEHLDFINMELFDEYMYDLSPTDIANRIYYGDFKPCDSYFTFNGYANLVSYDEWEIRSEYKNFIDDIVERVCELRGDIYLQTNELEDIVYQLDEIEG